MKWLTEKGCHYDEWTFAITIAQGNIKNLAWLKRNECHWNEETFNVAAIYGNLEVIDWMKRNECPMANMIPAKNCLEDDTIVQWFNTNGYLMKEGFGFVKI